MKIIIAIFCFVSFSSAAFADHCSVYCGVVSESQAKFPNGNLAFTPKDHCDTAEVVDAFAKNCGHKPIGDYDPSSVQDYKIITIDTTVDQAYAALVAACGNWRADRNDDGTLQHKVIFKELIAGTNKIVPLLLQDQRDMTPFCQAVK